MQVYLDRVEELGGTLRAIELNYFQREIADFAYDVALRKASGERCVVGVNKFLDETEDHEVEVHKIDPNSERRQIERLREVKRTRNQAEVEAALNALEQVARNPDENLMPATIAAVCVNVSMGEIVTRLERVFGRYRETPVF